jgi:hypothetical protein
VSTHTCGNVPLDARAALAARHLRGDVWWTEWGVTPTHFASVTDSAFGAPFVLHGMKAAQHTADAVAYWVVSDHFEELGRPDRLWHGGFGLLSVGNPAQTVLVGARVGRAARRRPLRRGADRRRRWGAGRPGPQPRIAR